MKFLVKNCTLPIMLYRKYNAVSKLRQKNSLYFAMSLKYVVSTDIINYFKLKYIFDKSL